MVQFERFTDRVWYLPLVSLLAGIDLFVLFIPTEGLLVTSALLRPKRWFVTAIAIATGSALGALALGAMVHYFGQLGMEAYIADKVSAESWTRATELVERHGVLAIMLMALGPLPLSPVVAVVAIAQMDLGMIFVSAWIGRAVKYLFFAWAATHAPRILRRFSGTEREIKQIEHAKVKSQQKV
jgi:membrane protein YqaA with SNARE-associated domain